jgi:two-component sensor histidine kinase
MQDVNAVRAAVKPVPVVSLALQDALRSSDRLLDCLPVGICTCDLDGKLVQYNRRAAELWGYDPDLTQVDHKFAGAYRLYRPTGEPLPSSEAPMNEVLRTGKPVRDRELVFERPNGSRIAVLANLDPLFDRNGKMIGAINCLQDITALRQARNTEHKQAQAQQNRLVEELNHRVKNTLATVQSLAGQSFRRPGVPPDVRTVFEARLYALARAHDQLATTHWQSADLKPLAENIFAPYEDDGKKRLHVDGPSVALSPRAALTFAMVLHELTTNAVKHGSLSTPHGWVKVAWSVATGLTPPTLHFRWQEAGGPPVVEPGKRGFGIRLVEQGVRRELEGEAAIVFDPEGLQCRIEIPLAQRED